MVQRRLLSLPSISGEVAAGGQGRGRAHGHLHVTFDTWPELLGAGRDPRNGVVRWMRHCKGKGETLPSNTTGWLDLTEGAAYVTLPWAQRKEMGRVISFITAPTHNSMT